MSKVIRVTVLCPRGRRETVNLTSNSSVLQILEEACRKQNINPNDFDLCHYNKPLDLTLPVRFANLANNAQLELQPTKSVRKECLVTVGLQMETGERVMKDFVPSTTVWDVMQQCLQMRSDQTNLSENGEPVCIYMRQKLVGDAIKNTTLRSLGLTKGSAIIRLLYRNPEDLSDQAHVSSPLNQTSKEQSVPFLDNKSKTVNVTASEPVFKNVPKPFAMKTSVPGSTNVTHTINENLNSFPVDKKYASSQYHTVGTQESIGNKYSMENASAKGNNANIVNKKESLLDQNMEVNGSCTEEENFSEKDIGNINYIGERHAVLYSLNDITEVKKADFPDEFFELTVQDVRYLMEEYKRIRNDLENQPLLTKELRKQRLLQKLGAYKQTVIRIYFPERLVLQGVFQASETVQDVCEFVRKYLEDKSLNFYLYTAPPKETKDPAKSLIELMLIPAAVVYFGCDSHCESYLMNSLKDKISDPRAASLAARESRKEAEVVESADDSIEIDLSSTTVDASQEEYKAPSSSVTHSAHVVQSGGKVPKWLKLSRK